jgi:hypothetical protein
MTETLRWSIVACLLYGAYITATCPCRVILECHKSAFYASVGGAAVLGLVALNAPPSA